MSICWFPAGGLLLMALWAVDGRAADAVSPSAFQPPAPSPTPARPAAATQDDAAEPDGKALFLKNCASCHGENGDGQGVTELDRPARSFRDGGFSYGNTPEAIVRTITNGIPGTPMPAFDSSSTAAERLAMAAYVIELGPPGVVVDPESTELVVHDRPLVVRGLLPPIVEGADAVPRGLLLGTVDGLTFQYRADDVQLLGVRAGRFVDRRDWGGRGGDALEPLGQLVHLVDGGAPRGTFLVEPQASTSVEADVLRPLRADLDSTWVVGSDVGLRYSLFREGERVTTVMEAVDAVGTSVAAGFRRRFWGDPENQVASSPMQQLILAVDSLGAGDEILEHEPLGASAVGQALVVRRANGVIQTVLAYERPESDRDEELGAEAQLEVRVLPGGAKRVDLRWSTFDLHPLELTILSGTTYEDDHLQTIRAELNR